MILSKSIWSHSITLQINLFSYVICNNSCHCFLGKRVADSMKWGMLTIFYLFMVMNDEVASLVILNASVFTM